MLRKVSQLFQSKNSDSPRRRVQAQHTQDIPNNNNPSRDTPPSLPPTCPSERIPRNILAFRTITKLLSQIQQEKAFQVSRLEAKLPQPHQRLELRLSNAFATIAVIEHEIVAVVTKRTPESLKVFACPQTPINDGPPITPLQSRLLSQIWHLLITQNYRRSDLQPAILSTKEPTIDDVRIVADIDLDDDKKLKLYVDEHWSHSTIADHLLILSKLLTMKEPSIDDPQRNSYSSSERLLRYVIATCYPKMKRRLKHRTLSLPYIKSLEEIPAFQFDKSKLSQASKVESANDLLFVRKFMLPFLSNIGTEIPKLIVQAKALEEGKPVYLYTEDTCAEFHALFLELLRNFLTSLDALEKARGDPGGPTKGSKEFEEAVDNVMFLGYALEKLAKGAALRMHLQTIAHFLRSWNIGARTPAPALEEEQEELDEELKAVQPFVSVEGNQTPLWKSYGDWLRLLVAHFDAVDILVGYINGLEFQRGAISIQILVAPPVNQDLLPWRELFTDSTLFPTETVWDPPSDKPNAAITNADILKFLNKAVGPSSKAQTLKKQWSGKKFDSTIKSLEELKSSNLPGWGEYTTKLLAKLKDLKDPPELGSAMYHEISGDIQAVLESTKFFASLDDTRGFSGTLHCEACLASLLDKNATVSKAILDQMEGFGSIIGISKRCCPTCQHLLFLLGKGRSQPFATRGSHNTVTACTLPIWLPREIVDSMNSFFGAQLRRDLVELIDRPQLLRHRVQSTGSQRLSSDSAGQTYDNLHFSEASAQRYLNLANVDA